MTSDNQCDDGFSGMDEDPEVGISAPTVDPPLADVMPPPPAKRRRHNSQDPSERQGVQDAEMQPADMTLHQQPGRARSALCHVLACKP